MTGMNYVCPVNVMTSYWQVWHNALCGPWGSVMTGVGHGATKQDPCEDNDRRCVLPLIQ